MNNTAEEAFVPFIKVESIHRNLSDGIATHVDFTFNFRVNGEDRSQRTTLKLAPPGPSPIAYNELSEEAVKDWIVQTYGDARLTQIFDYLTVGSSPTAETAHGTPWAQ